MDPTIASHLDTLRAALAPDAAPDARRAGAAACRTLLAVLDTQPGAPLTARAPSHAALVTVVRQLGQLDADQVLDLVITKLRSMLPADAAATAARGGFQLPVFKTPPRGGA